MTRVGKRANIEAVNMNELIHALQNRARMRIRLRIYRYVLTWQNSLVGCHQAFLGRVRP